MYTHNKALITQEAQMWSVTQIYNNMYNIIIL